MFSNNQRWYHQFDNYAGLWNRYFVRKMVGVAWTFDTGNVVVPTSGSTYWYNMTSDNLSNACSSSYTGTSSNPKILFTRSEAPSVGEKELGWGNTVTFYDGSVNYGIITGKIKIDTVTTTAVTGKMYAKGSDSDNEINGTFTLSRCCSGSLCSEWDYYNYGVCRQKVLRNNSA